jgi:fucokinase
MFWDLLILTARTRQQAWLFERYLQQAGGASGAGPTRVSVVQQDPPGPQLGTAAATLQAAATAGARLAQLNIPLEKARVLVLHCGGLSQRVPQLAHTGKAFAPGPDLKASEDVIFGSAAERTVFTQVVEELARLFSEMDPGIVVACGDVYFQTRSLQTRCRRDEAVAVACRVSSEQAGRHGVYLWQTGQRRAADSWQKPAVERLQSLPETSPWGMDTGSLYLGADLVAAVLRASGASVKTRSAEFWKEWRGLELYRDLTPPLTHNWTPARALPGTPGRVQQALSNYGLRVVCPEPARFLHFGTTGELMQILAPRKAPCLFASYVPHGEYGDGVIMDRCFVEAAVEVGAGSYISGLSHVGQGLQIGANRIVYQLPLTAGGRANAADGFFALGTGDDPRVGRFEGATLLGQPLQTWISELQVSPEEVWEGIPETQRCLWNARLFPVAPGSEAAFLLPWLSTDGDSDHGTRVDRWRRAERVSMAEAGVRFDARRWWRHEQRIAAFRYARSLKAAVVAGDGHALTRLLEQPCVTGAFREVALRCLRDLGIREAGTLTAPRAWIAASALSGPTAATKLRERCFKELTRVLVPDVTLGDRALSWTIDAGETLEARAPVRVDLAGGWTDTPPQACELGGTVLNLALLLDGKRPIAARIRRLEEPVIELIAEDLGVQRRLSSSADLRSGRGPMDPFAVHLAALRLIGLGSGTAPARELRLLGGGIRLTTHSAVPKGSGLGTSSILGAAVLAVLHQAFGLDTTPKELCLGVLRLEQLMGTGGGWQDQVGGLWGGAKISASGLGIEQHPEVTMLQLSPEVQRGLAERMILFYTGEPRLAKDVLQRVVGSYLLGRREALSALLEMPALARRAAAALQQGDWFELGTCITRSAELNAGLEPTATNARLNSLLHKLRPLVHGAKLAGAGGGGFLFALARDAEAKQAAKAELDRLPAPAQWFEPELAGEGMLLTRVAPFSPSES